MYFDNSSQLTAKLQSVDLVKDRPIKKYDMDFCLYNFRSHLRILNNTVAWSLAQCVEEGTLG